MTANDRNVYAGGRVDGTKDNGIVIKLDPATQADVARVSVPEMVMNIISDETHVVAVGEKGTIWVVSANDLRLLHSLPPRSIRDSLGVSLLRSGAPPSKPS